jgi:hypothetical protein
MSPRTRRLAATAVATAAIAALGAGSASAALLPSIGTRPSPWGNSTLIAKAVADECWATPGQTYDPKTVGVDCDPGETAKTNEAYVWGVNKVGNDLWFGTAANVQCLIGNSNNAQVGPDYVCEKGTSDFRAQYNAPLPNAQKIPTSMGDWRPPHLYRLHNANLAPPIQQGLLAGGLERISDQLTGTDLTRLNSTFGIRSAGTIGKVTFLSGPTVQATQMNIFAFNNETGDFLGSTTLSAYNNIRKWVVANGTLYAAVGKLFLTNASNANQTAPGSGRIIKWNGDPNDPTAGGNLFSFSEVGVVNSDAAEIVQHGNRLYVGTWPDSPILGTTLPTTSTHFYAGMFRSPELPSSGGLPDSSASWDQIWDARNYEPDPFMASTYGVGAMSSFRGQLLWGTMHVPLIATSLHFGAWHAADYTGTPDTAALLQAAVKTTRSGALFSTANPLASTPTVQLQYGSRTLPVWNSSTDTFVNTNNNMGGASPKLGQSGFGNGFNNYIWSMATTNKGLFIGTMDHQAILQQTLGSDDPQTALLVTLFQASIPHNARGADLWLLPAGPNGSLTRAMQMDVAGVGNNNNYGVRNMIGAGSQLFLGTANPMNLAQAPVMGGWEIRRAAG